MKKIFIYLIFFILVNNVSFAFFGKLKVVCIDPTGEYGGIEVVEKNNSIKFNDIYLPIIQNDKDKLVAKRTYDDGDFYYIEIRKKSLLFVYRASVMGGSMGTKGRCEKI